MKHLLPPKAMILLLKPASLIERMYSWARHLPLGHSPTRSISSKGKEDLATRPLHYHTKQIWFLAIKDSFKREFTDFNQQL